MSGFNGKTCSLSGKRVFVAGHTGLVGAAVVRALQNEDCEILTVARSVLDLTDQMLVQMWFKINKPDIVIMAAAVVGGIAANIARPAAFFADNVMIQTNVMQAAQQVGVEKLVFLGSSCIYPRGAENSIKENALMTGPLEPTNEAYALAKIAGIQMAQSYRRQYGCDYISLMPCNLYGPGDRFDLEDSHVIPALMMKAHEAKRSSINFEVWGSGKPLREFLYIDDAAAAIIFALKHYSSEQILNVGTGEELPIWELAEMIADVVGFKGRIVFDVARPDGVQRKLIDSSRIYNAGWKPQTPLRSGLEKTYEWYCQSIAAKKAA